MLAGLSCLQAEELLDNGTFALGEMKWDIKGKADASPSDSTLLVTLDDRNWTILEQDLRLSKTPPSAIAIRIELMASADFKPAKESKEYSDVDFGMGGSYGWSARVFPKADCLIQVENSGGWEYRPVKLQTNGSWQTITANVEKLKEKKSVFTLAFPPGTGTVRLKMVSVDLK